MDHDHWTQICDISHIQRKVLGLYSCFKNLKKVTSCGCNSLLENILFERLYISVYLLMQHLTFGLLCVLKLLHGGTERGTNDMHIDACDVLFIVYYIWIWHSHVASVLTLSIDIHLLWPLRSSEAPFVL